MIHADYSATRASQVPTTTDAGEFWENPLGLRASMTEEVSSIEAYLLHVIASLETIQSPLLGNSLRLEDQSCPGFADVTSADASHIRVGTFEVPKGGSARRVSCIADETTLNHSIFSPSVYRYLLLVGEAGSGKTLCCQKVCGD